jgi:hypothetical protein
LSCLYGLSGDDSFRGRRANSASAEQTASRRSGIPANVRSGGKRSG